MDPRVKPEDDGNIKPEDLEEVLVPFGYDERDEHDPTVIIGLDPLIQL